MALVETEQKEPGEIPEISTGCAQHVTVIHNLKHIDIVKFVKYLIIICMCIWYSWITYVFIDKEYMYKYAYLSYHETVIWLVDSCWI